jgi:MraZ protein
VFAGRVQFTRWGEVSQKGGKVGNVVFRGGPVLALDGKGRITVPARHREQLMALCEGQMIIAKNPDGCLSLYPLPVWVTFEAELLKQPVESDPWRRLYIGSATEVEIDSGARVLIPPELRSWACLEKDVKFMGVGSNFELWDSARYDAREVAAIAAGRPEAIRNLVVR